MSLRETMARIQLDNLADWLVAFRGLSPEDAEAEATRVRDALSRGDKVCGRCGHENDGKRDRCASCHAFLV